MSIVSKAFLGCAGLISITIPNSVTSIGDRAFGGCSGLTSVTLPNKVKSIGNMTFSYCSGLTSVTIPNGVISIGDQAFDNCSGLTSVTIGSSVIFIGECAFSVCSSLKSVTCEATSVPSTESNAFHDVSLSGVSLYVPEASVGAYQTTEPWSGFGKILTLDGSEPDPDGIKSPLAEVKEGTVYNLAGQHVSKPAKGLYIVNGKKILKN